MKTNHIAHNDSLKQHRLNGRIEGIATVLRVINTIAITFAVSAFFAVILYGCYLKNA